MNFAIEAVGAADAAALNAVRDLWRQYWESMGLEPSFQGFSTELSGLPGKYAAPGGGLLLARAAGAPAGTAAFRALAGDACEAKRLYVAPQWRRRGLARLLLERVLLEAKRCGYRQLYGDTLPTMASALELYRQLGFEEVGPYGDNPTPGAIYLRLRL